MSKKKFNSNRNCEAKVLENSMHFDSAHKNPDAETIRRKGIKSPNHAAMKYRYQVGKATYFFNTKMKYEAFRKKQVS